MEEDGTSLHEARPALGLEGEWTLAGFSEHLATLELFVKPPEWEGAPRFRRWAFESAALDLALRQAGRPLHEVLEREPQRLRFVNSLSLGKQPSIEPVRRRLARSPGVRFKLTLRPPGRRARRRGRGHRRGRHDRLQGPVRLRGRGSAGAGRAVRPRARGFPGRVPGGPPRPARDRAAARRSGRARLLRRADPQRRGHRRDAAAGARGERQAFAIGSLRGLFEVYARCAREGRPMYGGGMGSWVSAAGRSSCWPPSFTLTPPTTSRRAPTTRTTRRASSRPARWHRPRRRRLPPDDVNDGCPELDSNQRPTP